MKGQLPLKVNPFLLAKQFAKLEGRIPVSDLPRLREVVCNDSGYVDVLLEFGKGEFGPIYIRGQISALLELECQRCGEPVSCDINVEPNVSPVLTDSQAKHLPKEFDPVLLDDESVVVADLVEEELLLSLPMIAKHPLGECQVKKELAPE